MFDSVSVVLLSLLSSFFFVAKSLFPNNVVSEPFTNRFDAFGVSTSDFGDGPAEFDVTVLNCDGLNIVGFRIPKADVDLLNSLIPNEFPNFD